MSAAASEERAAEFRLPEFLVIGAFKSGTTTLMSWLNQHPQIFTPWLQEPNFFASAHYKPFDDGVTRPHLAHEGIYNRRRTDSLSQYASLFEGAPPDVSAGESSPWYLRDPVACARIAAVLPDVKMLAILRNPADRAFSEYSHLVRDGIETGDFADAIRRPRSLEILHQYVETGFYGRQLRPYRETFAADQVRVVLFEDLRDNPLGMLRSLFGWLGVTPDAEVDTTEVRNVSGTPRNGLVAGAWKLRRRSQPYLKQFVPYRLQRVVDARLVRGLDRRTLDPVTRRELIDIYAEDIRLLGELIDRDLDHWLA